MIHKRTREIFTRVILCAESEHCGPSCSPFLLPLQKSFLCAAGKKKKKKILRAPGATRAHDSPIHWVRKQEWKISFFLGRGGGTTTHNQVDFIPYHHQQLLRQSPEFEAAHALFQTVVFCVALSAMICPSAQRHDTGCHVKSWKGWVLFQEIALPWKLHSCPLTWKKRGTRTLTGTAFPCHCARFFSGSFNWLSWVSSQLNGCCQLPSASRCTRSNKELTEGWSKSGTCR